MKYHTISLFAAKGIIYNVTIATVIFSCVKITCYFHVWRYHVYYVTIATVIFSCVKITCYFHVWRYHVFMWKLTWYFIGVYIIKNFMQTSKLFHLQIYPYLKNHGVELSCRIDLFSNSEDGRCFTSTRRTIEQQMRQAIFLNEPLDCKKKNKITKQMYTYFPGKKTCKGSFLDHNIKLLNACKWMAYLLWLYPCGRSDPLNCWVCIFQPCREQIFISKCLHV